MKRFSGFDKPEQNKTPPPTPHPQRNRKPIKSTIKKHDSICNVYDIYTGVSLPPHSQRACWAVSLYWLYIGSCTVLTHEIMFIHVQHPLATPLPSPSYTHTHTPAALSATNSRRGSQPSRSDVCTRELRYKHKVKWLFSLFFSLPFNLSL